MKLNIIILLTILACGWITLSAKGASITMSGSTTVLPVAQALAEAYMQQHNVNISVRGGGSGVGVTALMNGTADIANSSRTLKAEEVQAGMAKGVKPAPYAIAMDAITVIVNPANPVKNITLAKLKAVYEGSIKNWKELGGSNLPIVVISRDVSSGTYEVFEEKVLKGSKVINTASMLASNNAVATTVSTTPGAIGYIGMGYLTPKDKAISVEGITPSAASVKNSTYTLSRKLYMITNGRARGELGRFIDFVFSPAGQKIVTAQGFITIK